jgi:pyruvate kinase
VANAVLDGTDAIMLSGETANGSYPVESVRTMAKIALEAERVREEQNYGLKYPEPVIFTSAGAICRAAVHTANDTEASAIIAPTVSGSTARLMSSFRPHVPLVAITPSPMVQRQLCLYWGTYPLLTRRLSNVDEVVTDAITVAQRHNFVGPGDTVVLTAGVVGNVRSATNLMMVRTIERVVAQGTGLGQREVAGRIRRLTAPLADNSINLGPQDIVYAEHVDRTILAQLQRSGGLITPEAELDSHGAVAAIEYGIPAVIGAHGNLDALQDGVAVVLDATTGQVTEWKK